MWNSFLIDTDTPNYKKALHMFCVRAGEERLDTQKF